MTHPTLEDAARGLCIADGDNPDRDFTSGNMTFPCWKSYQSRARAVLLSIRPPDREDLPLRQLEARDYLDGILNG